VRYTGDVRIVGRRDELEQIGRLLDRAGAGPGGLLVVVGLAGAGKTALLEAAASEARGRGFDVLRASPAVGHPGCLLWAQLLRDAGAPDDLAAGLVTGNTGTLELDSAARHLVSGSPRLILVDDIERGGRDAIEVLSVVAARCTAAATAVIAAAAAPVGPGPELRLRGLSEEDLGAAAGGTGGRCGPCALGGIARAARRGAATGARARRPAGERGPGGASRAPRPVDGAFPRRRR